MQAGRRGQAVPVHGAQAARALDVRATVFVFVRDRARGERQAPPRRRTVQQQRRQADVPVAVPERQQRLEIGLHKGAQRVRVHGAVAQEKATKAEAEERRRRGGGYQWRRQEQVATVSDDQDDADDDDITAAAAAVMTPLRRRARCVPRVLFNRRRRSRRPFFSCRRRVHSSRAYAQ